MKALRIFLCNVLLLLSLPSQSQTTWHVDSSSAAGTPSGLSWADAFTDLNTALDSATSGDVIWVSEGTYFPDRGTTRRDSSFRMVAGVSILGGFSVANNDTTLSDRDWTTYTTILSGELQGDGDSSNNSYIIIRNNNNALTNTAVLDGFTIERANNTNTVSNLTEGGGMFNFIASPTIRNCIFQHNTVYGTSGTASGAGIFNHLSSPVISNCSFLYNKVYCNSNVLATDKAFGGAIYNNSVSSPAIENCIFSYNEANGAQFGRGACIYNNNSSKPTLKRSVFTYNSCSVTRVGSGNTSNGAGVYNQGGGTTSAMTNCLFANNTINSSTLGGFGTIAYGGAVCNFNSGFYTIANCTFVNNTAIGDDAKGGAIWNSTSTAPSIVNSIIYGNTATAGANLRNDGAAAPGINHSDIGGCGGSGSWVAACGTDNGGNIDTDPFFTDDSNDDFTLDTCSPAFNTGNLSSLPSGTNFDLNNNARIQSDSVDMGAYEQSSSTGCLYTWDGSTDTDWNTAANWDRNEVPTTYAAIRIQDVTNDPVLDTIRKVGALTVDSNAALTLNRNRLQLYGNLTISGTINNDTSAIEFLGSGSQNITGDLTIDTLIANGSGGVTIVSGNTEIVVELELLQGNFSTGNALTLLSDSLRTARIAAIDPDANISGNVTTQQYVKGSINNWRLISAPIKNRTLQDWNDDFTTTGFPGSDFPSFGWVNTYRYNETITGDFNNGFTAPDTITNNIGIAQGWMIYMGGNDFTMDLTGEVNTGTIGITLDFTSNFSAADDGWNLIGNPMPSAVDFSNMSKSGMDNFYYIYDPATGNYAVWDEGGTTGTLGADGNIGQGQGFWVHGTSAFPSITFSEAAKTRDAGLFFAKTKASTMHIVLKSDNAIKDEAIIRLGDTATPDYEPSDMPKLYNSDIMLPALATVSADNEELVINSLGKLTKNQIVPIVLHGIAGSEFTLEFKGVDLLNQNACLVLEDLKNNNIIDLSNDTTYTVTLADSGTNSFLQLRLTTAPDIAVLINNTKVDVDQQVVLCENDFLSLIASGNENGMFSWNHGVENGTAFEAIAGNYTYSVMETNATTGCALSSTLSVFVDELPKPAIVQQEDELETGSFASYQWYFNGEAIINGNTQRIETKESGDYHVVVENENGCLGSSPRLKVNPAVLSPPFEGTLLNLYPNPGKVLHLRYLTTEKEDIKITVVDVMGKTIWEEQIKQSATLSRDYELNDAPAGIYFVRFQSNTTERVVRWVKQ
jgi:hypothetical protein